MFCESKHVDGVSWFIFEVEFTVFIEPIIFDCNFGVFELDEVHGSCIFFNFIEVGYYSFLVFDNSKFDLFCYISGIVSEDYVIDFERGLYCI